MAKQLKRVLHDLKVEVSNPARTREVSGLRSWGKPSNRELGDF